VSSEGLSVSGPDTVWADADHQPEQVQQSHISDPWQLERQSRGRTNLARSNNGHGDDAGRPPPQLKHVDRAEVVSTSTNYRQADQTFNQVGPGELTEGAGPAHPGDDSSDWEALADADENLKKGQSAIGDFSSSAPPNHGAGRYRTVFWARVLNPEGAFSRKRAGSRPQILADS
jgi:hypothetical protein